MSQSAIAHASPAPRPPLLHIVQQHCDDAQMLRTLRSSLVRAPNVGMWQLRRHDERLAASLDGIAVADDLGQTLCDAALEEPSTGAMFASAVGAVLRRDPAGFEKLLNMASAAPGLRTGLTSALGWVSAASLRGVTSALLDSPVALRREVGLASCAMHRVDPGAALERAAADPETAVAAAVYASALGRADLAQACAAHLTDERTPEQLALARAAIVLGERRRSIACLMRLAEAHEPSAVLLLMMALPLERALALLASLAQQGADARLLVQAAGAAGEARYVPWLIEQMHDPRLARAAGAAFGLVTGVDLVRANLERESPAVSDAGPTESPDDDDVALDEDERLPWPDAEKVERHWSAHASRFPVGERYFMGALLSPPHCTQVLCTGFQHQRHLAALHLSLMNPGTPVFNTAAPAWRQRRWLASMGG